MLTARRGDDGQLAVLIIGFLLIAAALVIVGIDASKVFLARRALSSAADAAALAAAQAVDRPAVYAGTRGGCGGLLPLDQQRAQRQVDETIGDDLADLHHVLVTIEPPVSAVRDDTVSVRLAGDVALPFGRLVVLLDPQLPGGRVHVTASAHAQAPLAVPGGCATADTLGR